MTDRYQMLTNTVDHWEGKLAHVGAAGGGGGGEDSVASEEKHIGCNTRGPSS